jgi:hypothetical protein
MDAVSTLPFAIPLTSPLGSIMRHMGNLPHTSLAALGAPSSLPFSSPRPPSHSKAQLSPKIVPASSLAAIVGIGEVL